MSALSANGLFENFDRPIADISGTKRKGKTLSKLHNLPTVNVWRVKEPQASEYLEQEILKFVSYSKLIQVYFRKTSKRN